MSSKHITARWICLILLLVGSEARTATVNGNVGVLTRMYVQATFGNGDVGFVASSSLGSCQSFWLKSGDAGFKNMYALILTARATQRPLLVWASDNELWSGSSIPSCRIEAIDFAD